MSPTPLLGLTADVGTGDDVDPDHNNRPANFLEVLAGVLVSRLIGAGLLDYGVTGLEIDEATARVAVPEAGEPIVGVIAGKFFSLSQSCEASGTADSGGSTTTLVDAALTADIEDFWADAYVIFTGGANEGSVRKVLGFEVASKTLSWEDPLAHPVGAGDTYVVTFFHISGLTSGATNYVYGRATSRTTPFGVLTWVANTTGTKASGDILVAKVTLDENGDVVGVDLNPEGADRCLVAGMGQVHEIVVKAAIEDLEAQATATITHEHDELMLLGPITIEVDKEEASVVVVDGISPNSLTIAVTNGSEYTLPEVNYTITRKGRLRPT